MNMYYCNKILSILVKSAINSKLHNLCYILSQKCTSNNLLQTWNALTYQYTTVLGIFTNSHHLLSEKNKEMQNSCFLTVYNYDTTHVCFKVQLYGTD